MIHWRAKSSRLVGLVESWQINKAVSSLVRCLTSKSSKHQQLPRLTSHNLIYLANSALGRAWHELLFAFDKWDISGSKGPICGALIVPERQCFWIEAFKINSFCNSSIHKFASIQEWYLWIMVYSQISELDLQMSELDSQIGILSLQENWDLTINISWDIRKTSWIRPCEYFSRLKEKGVDDEPSWAGVTKTHWTCDASEQ